MKNLKYFIASLLAIPFMAACYSDSADNPAFDDNDIPRIYRDWLPNLVANVGEPLILDHPVSPSDGATFTWTLDGTVISNERALNWTPTEFGIFTLRFEVVRNGIMNFREAQLVVAKPFEPKWSEGDMVSLGYLTLDGQISDVPWNDITHLVLSSSVIVDNLPDIMQNPPDGEEHPRLLSTELAALVTTAHNYGVYVMLQYSGTIAYINSAASYGATSFYNAAINPDTRTTLINTMLQFVAANGFDGMDIKMDKGVAGDPPGYSNPTALADFFNELAAAVPTETARGKYFLTQSLWTGYGSAQNTPMVTNPRYDWFNILAFAAEDLTPGPHSSIWVTMEPNVSAWIGRGVAASKLVPIAPAFGLRYFGNTADYTWGNLWQFTEYIPYRTLCATYPNAPETNTQPVDNGLWYDGLADVAQKADYAQGQGWGGMGLWSVENDALEPDKSLMHQINVSLAD